MSFVRASVLERSSCTCQPVEGLWHGHPSTHVSDVYEADDLLPGRICRECERIHIIGWSHDRRRENPLPCKSLHHRPEHGSANFTDRSSGTVAHIKARHMGAEECGLPAGKALL